MRLIGALLILLCSLVALAVAAKDDVACVVHSDDCGKCLSNGCNWCADGYCVSKDSEICDADKVQTTCSAKNDQVASSKGDSNGRGRRITNNICESAVTCAECAAVGGCFICVDPTTHLAKCSTAPTCVAPLYLSPYEWWIQLLAFNLSFTASLSCPVEFPAARNSPTIRIFLAVEVFNNSNPDASIVPESYIKGKVLYFLRTILPPELFDARMIIIISIEFNFKKRNYEDARVLVKFADSGDITAQAVAATLVDEAPSVFAVTDGTIVVDPLLPTTGTAGTPAQGRNSHSNRVKLSKGGLAGVIIGSIIGGALLVALIAWLIYRRRDAYPQAFRSPAAAYRP